MKNLAELIAYYKPHFVEITSEYNTHYFDMTTKEDTKAIQYFFNDEVIFYSYCEEKLNVSIK